MIFFSNIITLFIFILHPYNIKFKIKKKTDKSLTFIHSTEDVVNRIFLGVSFTHAQRRRNLKIKLKIDTPPSFRVCIKHLTRSKKKKKSAMLNKDI